LTTSLPSTATPVADGLLDLAERHLPGGVSAAARVNAAIGRPMFIASGEGAWLTDVDGRRFIDLETSFGAALLGHGHPAIRAAVDRAVAMGLLCCHETGDQARLAERIAELVPSAELVRFAGSGTETTWHATRIARAFTGRERVVKFEGHFHGFSDALGYNFWPSTAEVGDDGLPTVRPESAGTPEADRASVLVLPWNDGATLERVFARFGHEIAAVIMEPVNIDSGTIAPLPGYLELARRLTAEHGAVLIFDEILTGFRTGPGGAQAEFGVTPDLTTLGKALGGGMPLSAVVGRRDVMSVVAPLGPAVHSGTFMAHPTAILAGLAFLDVIGEPGFYKALLARSDRFVAGLRGVLDAAGLEVRVQAYGPRFSLLFGIRREPRNYADVATADRETERRFYREALREGVYLHHGWHHGISAVHDDDVLDEALDRLGRAASRTAEAAS
jgi:glutamate-1-semialdehyde 2,1-aminomutase